MTADDHELHKAKRELETLLSRMQRSEHARAFLGYADALVYSALQDLPRTQHEQPRVHTRQSLNDQCTIATAR